MLAKRDILTRARRLKDVAPQLIHSERVGVLRRALESLLKYPLPARERNQLSELLAECLVVANDFSTALSTLDNHPESDRVRYLRAYCLALTGHARNSLAIALPELRCAAPLDDQRGKWIACAGVALYRTGHYKWATSFFEQASAIFRITKNKLKLCHSLMDLALIKKTRGEHHLALNNLDDAITLIQDGSFPRTRLALLINRGVCLLQLGRLSQARTSFMRAEAIARKTHNAFSLIAIHNNLGHIYRMQGNFGLAAEFYESALSSARTQHAKRKECLALEFLGETLIETGEHGKAVQYLSSALSIAKSSSGHGDLVGEILRRRGEAFARLGARERAASDLNRAKEICSKRGERREELLVDRAIALMTDQKNTEARKMLQECLAGLQALGDRFEYSKTVVSCCASPKLRDDHGWLSDDLASATHYFRESGLEYWKTRLRNLRRRAPQQDVPRDTISGPNVLVRSQSPEYLRIQHNAQIAARGKGPVLLLGESGSGKEILARQIHAMSSRSKRPFVAINCGALPGELIESELFGHAKGAFTGSVSAKQGLLEAADGGFALLDEIGDLPLEAQVKLLRFLDTGEYRKVGQTQVRHVDVRVVAATNKNLENLIQSDLFRADLCYRLQTFVISVPPLRDRTDDILPLFHHFIRQAMETDLVPEVENDVIHWIRQHDWPGNVRELKNLADYIVAASWGESRITLAHLPKSQIGHNEPLRMALSCHKEELEKRQLVSALEATNGQITQAASILGIGRNTVTRKMHKYGLSRTDFATKDRE